MYNYEKPLGHDGSEGAVSDLFAVSLPVAGNLLNQGKARDSRALLVSEEGR